MPKEKPIIPYGIPNPIGPAIIPGTRNKARIGGEIKCNSDYILSSNIECFFKRRSP
jgi:hypothetical protein